MSDNNDFQWRPNDNSSSTRLKYDLEADHWLKSISHSQYGQRSGSMIGDIANMFLVTSFIFNVIELIFIGLWELIKFIIRIFWTPKPIKRPIEEPIGPRTFTTEEVDAIWNTPCKTLKNPWEDE